MFFSLPDGSESDVSSDSGDEFTVPSTSALAPIESSENDENIEPLPKKRPKKAYARKKKPKKACAKPIDHDSDHEEEEDDSLSAGWIAGQPCDIPVSIAENPPTYSQKLNVDCSACDAFSLYFDEEVWKMIVEETNLYAVQRMMPNWRTLTLLLRLRERGVFACGTFRSNKKDLPQEVKVDNKFKRDDSYTDPKGQFLCTSGGTPRTSM
ncbi:hypothetical protein HPB49_013620 [Dermacentor silvarum]|uniref:Uncharacterized protein n=1 Tax=Dermacentor silvarum TaxID=543639 RepID=A0ACB8DPK4_DERSI|nr:hypothetical protein HPB49_013620 [Dermacentor silvarum]